MVAAVEAGFEHIDTANGRRPLPPTRPRSAPPDHPHFFSPAFVCARADYWNQAGVGEALASVFANGRKRSDLFVTSKVEGCGVAKPPHGTPVRQGQCYNDTIARWMDDLSLLRLDHVDLMLVR